jgi:hypothetical protein
MVCQPEYQASVRWRLDKQNTDSPFAGNFQDSFQKLIGQFFLPINKDRAFG